MHTTYSPPRLETLTYPTPSCSSPEPAICAPPVHFAPEGIAISDNSGFAWCNDAHELSPRSLTTQSLTTHSRGLPGVGDESLIS